MHPLYNQVVSIIIAIETSIPQASIALQVDGKTIDTQYFESHRKQNKLLFPAIEAILDNLRHQNLTPDQIIVGTGPGSYSGVRISIAAAQGLATAYGCPVAGLGSFLATPALASSPQAILVGDARRDSLFIAEINHRSTHFDAELMEKNQFDTKLSELQHNQPLSPVISFEPELTGVEYQHQIPTAPLLIDAWNKLSQAERDKLNQTPPQPHYLRPPFITKAKPGHPLLRNKS